MYQANRHKTDTSEMASKLSTQVANSMSSTHADKYRRSACCHLLYLSAWIDDMLLVSRLKGADTRHGQESGSNQNLKM